MALANTPAPGAKNGTPAKAYSRSVSDASRRRARWSGTEQFRSWLWRARVRQPHAHRAAVVGLVAFDQATGRIDRGVQDVIAVGNAGHFDVLPWQKPVVFIGPANGHALLEVIEAGTG